MAEILAHVTEDERVEAVHLLHRLAGLVILAPGAERDQQRRAVYAHCQKLCTQFARLYRAASSVPRAHIVRELAIGMLYDEHGGEHIAERDPDTHVMLLQLLEDDDEVGHDTRADGATGGTGGTGTGTEARPGGAKAMTGGGTLSSLVFSSPLNPDDAFMMMGTD